MKGFLNCYHIAIKFVFNFSTKQNFTQVLPTLAVNNRFAFDLNAACVLELMLLLKGLP